MTAPTPTPPCLGEREAVARKIEPEAWKAREDGWETCEVRYRIEQSLTRADAIIAEHINPLRTESETLRAERDAAIARAVEAERRHEGRFWIELREPGCVPMRKGSFPLSGFAKTLREFMDARPTAFITVVTIDDNGPDFQHGPEALQMADARSMERGRKHNTRVREAHGDHATKVALSERDTALVKLAQAEGEIATMRRAFFKVAMIQARELQRLDPTGNTPPDLDAAMVDLRAVLTTPEPPHGE